MIAELKVDPLFIEKGLEIGVPGWTHCKTPLVAGNMETSRVGAGGSGVVVVVIGGGGGVVVVIGGGAV